MILTPKNWKSFQHYKERTPPWIKLHKGLLDDFEFSRLPADSRALAPMIWLLASEYEDGSINCSLEQMAFRLHMTVNDLKRHLTPLIDSGFFVASEALAPRKPDATLETEAQVKEEEEKESRPVAEATRPRLSSRFDEFWKEYPKREGDNPRKPAEKKFNALVKTGVDPEIMIAGARQASADARARAIYATKFVPQAIKWLNDQRFADYAAASFSSSSEPKEITVEQAVAQYARIRVWPRGGPINDISQVPADILAKYNLAPDGRKLEALQ